MSADIDLNDQVRGMAMALRHWFDVRDLEAEQRRAGLLPSKNPKDNYDKSLRPLTITCLPPQLVRLKPNAPMTTLHFMQDVYDDGFFRADPWRWWFAWITIELVARFGPDKSGERVRRFVIDDPSIQPVRDRVVRWLGANPLRLDLVQDRLSTLAERAVTVADSPGRTLAERIVSSVRNLDHTLVDAMAEEAARLSTAITGRLEEQAQRR
ncbi:MAG: hypothetical protein HQ481_11940 [Alphaproteobacteria bacterium]|nr:hypothetical protein [Alphaproteobacteria bacterium]